MAPETAPITFITSKEFGERVRAGEKPESQNVGVLKGLIPSAIKLIDEAQRIIEFTISTANLDRMGDTIDQNGWDLKNFIRGGQPVLFAHDKWRPVVGRGVRTWLETNMLKSQTQFVPREIDPFGYMIFQLYANDYMRATSVGFMPMEYSYAEDRKFGLNFLRQELLEYSMVPVPANPDCLSAAKSAGIDTAPMKAWAERTLDLFPKDGDAMPTDTVQRDLLERLRNVSNPDGERLIVVLRGMKFTGSSAPAEVTMHVPELSELEQRMLSHIDTVKKEILDAVGRKDPGDETPTAPAGDPPPADPTPVADPPPADPTPVDEPKSADDDVVEDLEPESDPDVIEDLDPETPAAPVEEELDVNISAEELRAAMRESLDAELVRHTGKLDAYEHES